MSSPFSSAHRLYVKSLYKRFLKNELDWIIRRDIWRAKALEIRAEFEKNRSVLLYSISRCNNNYDHIYFRRNISDPRALAEVFEKAEAELASKKHPDPYIRKLILNTTKAFLIAQHHEKSSPISRRL